MMGGFKLIGIWEVLDTYRFQVIFPLTSPPKKKEGNLKLIIQVLIHFLWPNRLSKK